MYLCVACGFRPERYTLAKANKKGSLGKKGAWYIFCDTSNSKQIHIDMIKEDVNTKVLDDEPIGGAVGDQMNFDEPSKDDPIPDNVAEGETPSDDNSAQLAEAQAAAEEWKDKYMRLSAEFDNYRKRTLKEKLDLRETGCTEVIKTLLVVIDDIDRALAATKTATDVNAVRDGVILIHQKLMDTLRTHGLQEIDALGEELDTDLHEAVAKFPVEDAKQKGKIIDVVQKGYKLKDKVARYAKVVVGE